VLVSDNIVPSSRILLPLMMEALPSSESLIIARATRRNIPEDDIYIIYLYSYIFNTLNTSNLTHSLLRGIASVRKCLQKYLYYLCINKRSSYFLSNIWFRIMTSHSLSYETLRNCFSVVLCFLFLICHVKLSNSQ
jgi:hypothetical protein